MELHERLMSGYVQAICEGKSPMKFAVENGMRDNVTTEWGLVDLNIAEYDENDELVWTQEAKKLASNSAFFLHVLFFWDYEDLRLVKIVKNDLDILRTAYGNIVAVFECPPVEGEVLDWTDSERREIMKRRSDEKKKRK